MAAVTVSVLLGAVSTVSTLFLTGPLELHQIGHCHAERLNVALLSGVGFLQGLLSLSVVTSFPVSGSEKHPQTMMLPPPRLTLLMRLSGDEQNWVNSPDIVLGVLHKEFSLCVTRLKNLSLPHALAVL